MEFSFIDSLMMELMLYLLLKFVTDGAMVLFCWLSLILGVSRIICLISCLVFFDSLSLCLAYYLMMYSIVSTFSLMYHLFGLSLMWNWMMKNHSHGILMMFVMITCFFNDSLWKLIIHTFEFGLKTIIGGCCYSIK